MIQEKILISLVQGIFLIALSPLLGGVIKKVKAFFQYRQGPPLLQGYYDIAKYFRKEVVVSDLASWIFTSTPYVVLACAILAAFLVPSVSYAFSPASLGDVITVIYIFALARFFMALSAMDTASAFGGMASSREMMISSIAEPAMLLCFISLAMTYGSTNLANIMAGTIRSSNYFFALENLFVFFAMFLIVIAETGRVPFDNPATHLELTMVHEGMILEYSGRYLAMMTLASCVKQAVLFTLIVNVFFPYGMLMTASAAAFAKSAAIFAGKLVVFSVAVGAFESSLSKFRLFQVPDLVGLSFVLALTGIITNAVRF